MQNKNDITLPIDCLAKEKKTRKKKTRKKKDAKEKKMQKKKRRERKKRRIKAPHPDQLRNYEAGHTYGGLKILGVLIF